MIQKLYIYIYIYFQKKAGTWTDTWTPMFIAAWFTVAKRWKQPKCLSTDQWINKIWYLHTKEYNSAFERKGNSDICHNMDEPWRHYLNEIDSHKKQIDTVWSHLYEVSKIVSFTVQKVEWWLPGAGRSGERGVAVQSYRVQFSRWRSSGDLFHKNANILNTTELYT